MGIALADMHRAEAEAEAAGVAVEEGAEVAAVTHPTRALQYPRIHQPR